MGRMQSWALLADRPVLISFTSRFSKGRLVQTQSIEVSVRWVILVAGRLSLVRSWSRRVSCNRSFDLSG